MSDRPIIPKVVNGKVVITNKSQYDEIILSMEQMESALDNAYQLGTSCGITRVLDILEHLDTQMLKIVKDALYQQEYKEQE